MPLLNVASVDEARSTWLAALHQLALVDGDFDPEEQRLLAEQLNEDCPLQGFDWKHWRAPRSVLTSTVCSLRTPIVRSNS